jgi:Flp pilus assembly protein TadG
MNARLKILLDRREQGGAAAVEFALLAPILILLVVGLLQYGFYFWSAQGGSNAAREAARRAAVGDLIACTDFRTYVRDRIDALGNGDNAATITRTYVKGPGNTKTDVEVGDVVTVIVTFNSIDLNIPLLPFPDKGEVTQSADARVENVPTSPGVCT